MYLFGQKRQVFHIRKIDTGGMFESTAGVYMTEDGKFRAFLQDGWGAGVAGKTFESPSDARKDIERLAEKYL